MSARLSVVRIEPKPDDARDLVVRAVAATFRAAHAKGQEDAERAVRRSAESIGAAIALAFPEDRQFFAALFAGAVKSAAGGEFSKGRKGT